MDYYNNLMETIHLTRTLANAVHLNKSIAQYNAGQAPFEGIGKPELLKQNLAGFWSRGIDDTSRLVYGVNDTHLTIISCRYHY